jgi:Fe-S-cluster containining protein
MEDHASTPCQRCGTCCQVDFSAYATTEDIARWHLQSRADILHLLEEQRATWAGDRLVAVGNGEFLAVCCFLRRDRGRFACAIYETRPKVCRQFVPGSSSLCPQFGR